MARRTINIGKVIFNSLMAIVTTRRELAFPALITGLCRKAGVPMTADMETIKSRAPFTLAAFRASLEPGFYEDHKMSKPEFESPVDQQHSTHELGKGSDMSPQDKPEQDTPSTPPPSTATPPSTSAEQHLISLISGIVSTELSKLEAAINDKFIQQESFLFALSDRVDVLEQTIKKIHSTTRSTNIPSVSHRTTHQHTATTSKVEPVTTPSEPNQTRSFEVRATRATSAAGPVIPVVATTEHHVATSSALKIARETTTERVVATTLMTDPSPALRVSAPSSTAAKTYLTRKRTRQDYSASSTPIAPVQDPSTATPSPQLQQAAQDLLTIAASSAKATQHHPPSPTTSTAEEETEEQIQFLHETVRSKKSAASFQREIRATKRRQRKEATMRKTQKEKSTKQNRYISYHNLDSSFLQLHCRWDELSPEQKGKLWSRLFQLPWPKQLEYLQGKFPISALFKHHDREIYGLYPIPKSLCTTRKLLILDLNGILVDVCAKQSHNSPPSLSLKFQDVYLRPFVFDFLRFCHEHFQLAIWTSRQKHNADRILDGLFAKVRHFFLFEWTQEHCSEIPSKDSTKSLFLKDLSRVWVAYADFNPASTILVDDSPDKAAANPPHTGIFLPSFHFSANSTDALLQLDSPFIHYMEMLRDCRDVRAAIQRQPYSSSFA